MSDAVLDRPVAPSAWVHETRTSGTDLYAEYLTSAEPSGVLLQRPGRLARISQTNSPHLVSEQHYFCRAWETAVSSAVLWQVRPILFAAPTPTAFDVQTLPPADTGFARSHISRALQAADDLREWLDLTYDDIAAMSGLAKRTLHYWRATGAHPRPATVRRLLEIHALVQAMRRKLGPEQFGDWIRTGAPSPLELLQSGDWDAVQKAAYGILFQQPRRERDFAGYSPYDPETDFSVGAPGGQEFRRATRSPRRGRLPQP